MPQTLLGKEGQATVRRVSPRPGILPEIEEVHVPVTPERRLYARARASTGIAGL